MNPQYIKLTAVKVMILPGPNERRQNVAQMTVLNPHMQQLIPLPQTFTKDPVTGQTQIDRGPVVTTYREQFDDVLQAISDAATFGGAIAVPIDREKLAEAAGAGLTARTVNSGVVVPIAAPGLSPSVQEAVETAVNGVKAALDAEEAKAEAPVGEVDEKGVRWDDVVQTDGENVGEPKYKRQPRVGDLRIHSCEPGRYFLEQAHAGPIEGEHLVDATIGIIWAAPHLPFPLLRTFDSRDQLIEEVAKAGRESLLVNA
jgi:hypothetical protein